MASTEKGVTNVNCVEVFGAVGVALSIGREQSLATWQGPNEKGADQFMFTVGNNHLVLLRLPRRGAGQGRRNRGATGDYTEVETVGRKVTDSGPDKHSSRKK